MAQIAIIDRKCDRCGACVRQCPFQGLDILANGCPEPNAACRVCGICLKVCPRQAIVKLETRVESVDKSQWKDILVVAEAAGCALHPVSLELIGKARELAAEVGFRVKVLLIGSGVSALSEELRHYGADEIAVYDDPSLSFFRADAFAACAEDYIKSAKPSVVLVGATSLGRSLAPRLSTRFHTGLTADCTRLEMRANTDLVQIRPAFGGNIMAQIVTPGTRPQFATVRYRVMEAPERCAEPSGTVVTRKIPKAVFASPVRHIRTQPIPPAANISEAEILVVGGRGLKKQADLEMVKKLADALGGEWAVSRPLVEKGWATNARQIGLSGRTVRPKLIVTCGVSGAIQFAACMNKSERIVAINSDPEAPIFDVAHVAIVGDLYKILPKLLERPEEIAT